MSAKSILFSEMMPDPAWEAAFNAWYDEEHIPDRMVLPGFLTARRYRAEDGTYLVVYEMDGLTALRTPGYQRVKNQPSARTAWMLRSVSGFTRNLGTSLAEVGSLDLVNNEPHGLTATLFNVGEQDVADFDAWCLPQLSVLVNGHSATAAELFSLSVAEPETYSRLLIEYREPPELSQAVSPFQLTHASVRSQRQRIFRSWGRTFRPAAQNG